MPDDEVLMLSLWCSHEGRRNLKCASATNPKLQVDQAGAIITALAQEGMPATTVTTPRRKIKHMKNKAKVAKYLSSACTVVCLHSRVFER